MSDAKKLGRRKFLGVGLGASAVGLASCSKGLPRLIVPQVKPSDGEIPGKARFYRSVCRACPAGCGLTARVREGRAIKLEGSPLNPIGQGALCATGQATIEELYSPNRLGHPMLRSPGGGLYQAKWPAAQKAFEAGIKAALDQKKQVVFVTRPEPGFVGSLFGLWLTALGQDPAQVVTFDPMAPDWLKAAAQKTFGVNALPRYDLSRAKLVLSFGADLMEDLGSPVEGSRGLSNLRRRGNRRNGRFIYVGPRLSLTATQADTYLSLRPGSELDLALGLCRQMLSLRPHPEGLPDGLAAALAPWNSQAVAASTGLDAGRIKSLARSIASARPSLVVGPGRSSVGEDAVQLGQAIYLLNALAGNLGSTFGFDAADVPASQAAAGARPSTALGMSGNGGSNAAAVNGNADHAKAQPVVAMAPSSQPLIPNGSTPLIPNGSTPLIPSAVEGRAAPAPKTALTLAELVRRAEAGDIGALIFHHADPLAYGDAFASLGKALDRIPFIASFTNRLDATAQHSHAVLADHHFLETWDQLALRTGVEAIQQPVMIPLLATKAAADVLLDAAQNLNLTNGLPNDGSLSDHMQAVLHSRDIQKGGIFKTAALATPVLAANPIDLTNQKPGTASDTSPVVLFPSVRHLNGLAGTNPLLEEIPDTVTSASWSGWVEVNPATAKRRGIETGDVLELSTAAGSVELAALVFPPAREDVFAAPLPYATGLLADNGRLGGRIENATVTKTGKRFDLVLAAGSFSDQHRGLVREVGENETLPKAKSLPTLYPTDRQGKRRWSLAVDLDKCNGCGACVAACYVENNIAIVGADQMRLGRSMEWLRIERYVEAKDGAPSVKLLPVMCQQCSDAPCEPVCPAYATYHTDEGLNAQVYNRCVGTRFCGNNCPYVARRFNWYTWPHESALAMNPDVTVRSRGVMEKCTFCVQRIRGAEEQAKMEKRPLKEGEVVPACVGTCSAGALVFGDLMDENSEVAQLSRSGRAYHILEDLNTRPGVTYLARRQNEELE